MEGWQSRIPLDNAPLVLLLQQAPERSENSGPNSDLSQTSHCNIKGLSSREVMRIENIITQVQFY